MNQLPIELLQNIHDNFVYHGSPYLFDILHGNLEIKKPVGLFVSPYAHIASCFILPKEQIINELQNQLQGRIIGMNIGFDAWDKKEQYLRRLHKIIKVYVNYDKFKKFKLEQNGYLYGIEFKKNFNRSYMWDQNPNSTKEFLMDGNIEYKTKIPLSIQYEIIPDVKRTKLVNQLTIE